MPDESVETNHPPGIPADLCAMHKAFLADAWEAWGKHRDKNSPEFHKFYRVSIVSLTSMAAATAVDVGLTKEQFLSTCKANYEHANKSAQRWA